MNKNTNIRRKQAKKHLRSVGLLYYALDMRIERLEEFTECEELSEEQVAKWNRFYGAKENESLMIIKLIAALSKIIPMEKDVMEALENIKDEKIQDISKEDVEIRVSAR